VLGDIAHSDEWLIPSTGDELLLIRDKKWLHISGSTIIQKRKTQGCSLSRFRSWTDYFLDQASPSVERLRIKDIIEILELSTIQGDPGLLGPLTSLIYSPGMTGQCHGH
jgi:hypothetical protein